MKKIVFSVIFSNFMGAGIAFLFAVFLARLLGVESYGRMNLIYSLVIVVFSLVEFGISNAVVIFYNKNKLPDSENDVHLIGRLNLFFIQYAIATIPVALMILYALNYVYVLADIEIVVLVVNYILFLVFRYLLSLHQAVGNWKIYNLLNILNNILKAFVMLLIIGVLSKAGYVEQYKAALYGYMFFPFVLVFTTLILSKELIVLGAFSKKTLLDIVGITVPLGLSNIFILLASRSDILFIEHKLGSSGLGIYAAGNTLALAFPLVTSALRNVFLKEMVDSNSDILKNILKKQLKLLPYIVVTYVFIICISKYIYIYLFGEEYVDSVNVFNILLVAYIGGVCFTPLESYMYGNDQKKVACLKFIQMLILILSCWILIDVYGLIGAATSVVLSRFFGWLYVLNYTIKVIKEYDFA